MIHKIIKKIHYYWNRRSSNAYIRYLRGKGIEIGRGTQAKYPLTIEIDVSRPELVTIGKDVFLHKHLTILSHDYASQVFVNLYASFIPSHGKIKIGNNVWFGEHCTVLKGVTVGDNCIIGYGSTVMKDIPANSVVAGTPAKVICSIEDYYQKRKEAYIKEVFEYALEIEKKRRREPVIEDFQDDYPAFVDASNYLEYGYPFSNVFTTKELFDRWLNTHKAPFNGFNEFMKEYRKKKSQHATTD